MCDQVSTICKHLISFDAEKYNMEEANFRRGSQTGGTYAGGSCREGQMSRVVSISSECTVSSFSVTIFTFYFFTFYLLLICLFYTICIINTQSLKITIKSMSAVFVNLIATPVAFYLFMLAIANEVDRWEHARLWPDDALSRRQASRRRTARSRKSLITSRNIRQII